VKGRFAKWSICALFIRRARQLIETKIDAAAANAPIVMTAAESP